MARASRDLRKYQTLLLAGGFAVYLLAIGAAALIAHAMAVREEAVGRQDLARTSEQRPPSDLLVRVPEVLLKDMPANAQQSRGEIAQLVQKIRVQDMQDADGFVKGLKKDRADLNGLPFLMGGACRMAAGSADLFGAAVGLTHDALRAADSSIVTEVDPVDRFLTGWNGNDTPSGVAALTQIYGPQKGTRREGLAKHLKAIDHPAATRALARAAVFDFNGEVRWAAIDGLKTRPKEDSTEVLLAGLRHPWPVAAQNAARAISRLDRHDLVPQMVAFLAEANPRDPFETDVDGKHVNAVREMVKINHHRNCLLCHPPAPANSMPGGVMAVVPTPGESFAPPSMGGPYGGSPGDAMIRADITYLRQDFSIMASVANAQPWPEMQRFDFLVRTRVLTDREAQDLRTAQKARPAGEISENHKAVAAALQRLTGKENVAPTARAWAQALDLAVPEIARQ
jgi:hypothetical protein